MRSSASERLCDVVRPDAGVHVALARPHLHLAARHALEVRAQEHVGEEQDLAILGHGLDHLAGVPRRAAVVRERLHLGCRVHVAHDDRARVLVLPAGERCGVDRRGQRAAGVEVGDEDRLLRGEHGGCLGHEVHAAEDDHVRLGRCRLL